MDLGGIRRLRAATVMARTAAIFVTLTLWSAAATAERYQTVLNVSPTSAGIDRVVFDWASAQTSGSVFINAVTDLSVSLLDGDNVVYSDTVIVDGIVQPIGGTSRTAGDLFWVFNLTTNELEQLSNAIGNLLAASSGTQYRISDGLSIPEDALVRLLRWETAQRSPSRRQRC